MINISSAQSLARFKTLPPRIKDSIFSETDAELIRKIAQDNHLSKEKTSSLARILSYIFLGFIHASDLKRQIEENLHINPQAADALAKIVDVQLIEPYREDLEKIYRPLSEEDFGLATNRRKEDRIPAPSFVDLSNKPFKLDVKSSPITQATPTPTTQQKSSVPAPSVPRPTPTPFVMGSRQTESKPINTPREFKVSSSIPSPQRVPLPAPSPSRPARVELGKMNEVPKPAPQTKDVGREPIKYSSPKNIFMPSSSIPQVPKPPTPSIEPIPPKTGVKIIPPAPPKQEVSPAVPQPPNPVK